LVIWTKSVPLRFLWLVALASTLPSKFRAEVLIEPPVMRLKVIFQPLPADRNHFLPILTFLVDLPSFGLPVRQVKEIQDKLQSIRRVLEKVLAI